MNSIKKLNERIRDELHLKEEDYMDDEVMPEDDFEAESDEAADDEATSSKDSRSRIRIESETKIRGLIRSLEFDVDFRDLADRVNEQIDGIVLTREKAHQLFNIFRDLMGF